MLKSSSGKYVPFPSKTGLPNMSSSVVVSLSVAGSSMNILFTLALLTPLNPWNGHRPYSHFINTNVIGRSIIFSEENETKHSPGFDDKNSDAAQGRPLTYIRSGSECLYNLLVELQFWVVNNFVQVVKN